MLTLIYQLTPQALKAAVTTALVTLMAPIQEEFQASSAWQEIEKKAYPSAVVEKKPKKVKDKGTRHPGAAGAGKAVTAQPDGSVQRDDEAEVSLGKAPDVAIKNLKIGQDESNG